MKTARHITSQEEPRFGRHLLDTTITLIHHDDDSYEFMCERKDGTWMNGRDFISEKGALNACFRKLEQGIQFAPAINSETIEAALAFNKVFGIGKPSHELNAFLNQWDKKHKTK